MRARGGEGAAAPHLLLHVVDDGALVEQLPHIRDVGGLCEGVARREQLRRAFREQRHSNVHNRSGVRRGSQNTSHDARIDKVP